ncbi:MAG: rRNA maturation RNase YbeY [bacterium]|nr:rRNA maturation RNase YbeY [bacterium]
MAASKILVFSSVRRYEPLVKKVEKTAAGVLAAFGNKNGRIEIFLISDIKMRNLNRTFRRKDKVTNVLAFLADGFSRPDLKGDFLGEVYLAPTYINTKKQELSKLVIHGLVHLFGYDHIKKNDRIRMESLEEKIFEQLKKRVPYTKKN